MLCPISLCFAVIEHVYAIFAESYFFRDLSGGLAQACSLERTHAQETTTACTAKFRWRINAAHDCNAFISLNDTVPWQFPKSISVQHTYTKSCALMHAVQRQPILLSGYFRLKNGVGYGHVHANRVAPVQPTRSSASLNTAPTIHPKVYHQMWTNHHILSIMTFYPPQH